MSDDLIPPLPRDLTPEETERLVDDLANGIHKPETLAARYGFRDVDHLKLYLRDSPWVVERANRRRALLESDKGTGERVVLRSQVAVDETIPYMAGIIMNPAAAAKDRIDAFKELRQAGAVGVSKDKTAAGASNQFVINFMFRGGKETISTTVVPEISIPMIGDNSDEDGAAEEDV